MNINNNGLIHIAEIYNKYNIITNDILQNKILITNKNIVPIIQKRLENIYTYINNINEELNDLENDIEKKDNNNYIHLQLIQLTKIEDAYNFLNNLYLYI